jgi:hypothetical protein
MTGPTPGFAIRPMVMGVVLTPRSGTLSGATITVTTEAHEPDWQGASRRPDGRQDLWRPNSDRDLVGQYAIQWPNYCKQDPITIITTCTGTRQARALLVTGYAPGGNAEVREQVQQPMQQIALSVQPITNALPPSPSPPDLLQTKVLLGNGGRGTASWEAWLEPRDGKPGFAVRFPQAKPGPIRHWQQLDPLHPERPRHLECPAMPVVDAGLWRDRHWPRPSRHSNGPHRAQQAAPGPCAGLRSRQVGSRGRHVQRRPPLATADEDPVTPQVQASILNWLPQAWVRARIRDVLEDPVHVVVGAGEETVQGHP